MNNAKLDNAWREYIQALEDHAVPYSRVVELRSVYENILREYQSVNPW
jgi:hypothetical protein